MDELIYIGGAVKALGGGRVGGYLVEFTDFEGRKGTPPDLTKEYFTDSTDYDVDFPATRSLYFDHGQDKVLKRRKLSKVQLKQDEVGVWAEGILDTRDKYLAKLYELAEQGVLGWSSGSAPHLTEKKKNAAGFIEITSWPIVEESLTHQPCNPFSQAIPLKSYLESPEHKDFDSFFEEAEAPSQLTFQQHSEAVVGAVEEFATKADAVAKDTSFFVKRVHDTLEFRSKDPVKAGRTISQTNRERLAQASLRLKAAMDAMQQVHADLGELMVLAEPKPKEQSAFEMEPAGIGKALPTDDLTGAALAAVANFEALRFELTVDPSRR
jgi:hypothetical protein